MRVVICGGGVIGACSAYFLARRGVETIVVERTGVACAASGKSGGFLARDWCDGTPLGPLARRSFALHEELAATLGRDWGFRRLDTVSVAASARRVLPRQPRNSGRPAWLAEAAVLQGQLGSTETTAQVDPASFTRGMMDSAIAQGARLVEGRVEGITVDAGRAAAVVVSGAEMAADAVLIAMGPWTELARAWLRLPPVHGLKGHSVVYRPDQPVSAHALFADVETEDGAVISPEVFPRADGTIYVCGDRGTAPLPDDPGDVLPEPGGCARLARAAGRLSDALDPAGVVTEQACYRPITRDGLPLIGPVAGAEGAYVATGHSVWGMLNAPATGEAVAELIVEGRARSVDIAPFDPARRGLR